MSAKALQGTTCTSIALWQRLCVELYLPLLFKVGDALEELERCGYSRKDLFIQTKFTQGWLCSQIIQLITCVVVRGQDPSNIPYDPTLPLQQQVKQSVAKSLANLKTTYIDSLVLHSPMHSHGETMLVWKTLEAEVAAGNLTNL